MFHTVSSRYNLVITFFVSVNQLVISIWPKIPLLFNSPVWTTGRWNPYGKLGRWNNICMSIVSWYIYCLFRQYYALSDGGMRFSIALLHLVLKWFAVLLQWKLWLPNWQKVPYRNSVWELWVILCMFQYLNCSLVPDFTWQAPFSNPNLSNNTSLPSNCQNAGPICQTLRVHH